MKNITLSNGVPMPILGFGTFQIEPEQTQNLVSQAIRAGYRHIDTAQSYQNEREVGLAIKNSGIARDEFFITTKVWINNYTDCKASILRSLDRMGLDYVDLVLLHQPFGDTFSAWRDLENLYHDGKIRAIGVSNFMPSYAVALGAGNQLMPMVNQIEVNPFFQRPTEVEQLQNQGIAVQAWASFAEGKNDIFNNPILLAIAQKYGKTPAQVISRWLVQRNIVALVKSSRLERMQENLAIFDFELTADDNAKIATLDLGKSLIFDHSNPEIAKFLMNYKVDV